MPTPEPAPRLIDRLGHIGRGGDDSLERFLDWVADTGLEPYAAQEEALLEIWADHHVVLGTPTGSGKSLVALALHWKGLCEGKRSYYTAPIKALVSEKFFALCEQFGAENVGMLTGDASINPAAPIVCCTAEILSNMALRRWEDTDAPYVCMDEFHYYGDADRGAAWQIPLLVLRDTTFLLMSATLGDTSAIREDLFARTGREVALVESDDRPVPLDFEYVEEPMVATVERLLAEGRAPIYIVNFTQRDAAELAGGLTSAKIADRELRMEIRDAIGDFRFDTTYGKDIKRFLSFGVGLHHAGLLPKYRLLVERLAQAGLLRVICGTDTLGVGVNIPIRTVLFSKLAKFDGRRVGLLRARDFRQIAGRAGRRGFDTRGSVVALAPEAVIEARRAKLKQKGRNNKKARPKHAPAGSKDVQWNRDTFERLRTAPPEPLRSRFRLQHGMIVNALRSGETSGRGADGYARLIRLIDDSHEDGARRRNLRRYAAVLFRSLRTAKIIEVGPGSDGRRDAWVNEDLQWNFDLHHTLSLLLVDAIAFLAPTDPDYAADVLSLVECVLEDPRALLFAQVARRKRDLMAQLKAERVPFDERIGLLDEVGPLEPPNLRFIEQSFEVFREAHPWVRADDIHPKCIAREMFEGYFNFDAYVSHYGAARMEGVFLRYLSQVYTTLNQTVPANARTEAVEEMIAFFRGVFERVDSSLLEEWENLVRPGDPAPEGGTGRSPLDWTRDPRARTGRIRAEIHALVAALSGRDFESAAALVVEVNGDPWTPARLEHALEPFFRDYDRLLFDARARFSEFTRIEAGAPGVWTVSQTLLDPEGDNEWCIEAELDLRGGPPDGPMLRIERIGN